ncbi:MAG: permease [Spirochaetota bacterium]
MIVLYILSIAALLISLIASPAKSGQALRIALRRFLKLLPPFLTMLTVVALVLAALPKEVFVRYLGGDNLALTTAAAALLGSLTLMPGFIAFPVAAALQRKGARLAFLFTLIRYLVAVPLIVLSSELLAVYLQRRAFQINM